MAYSAPPPRQLDKERDALQEEQAPQSAASLVRPHVKISSSMDPSGSTRRFLEDLTEGNFWHFAKRLSLRRLFQSTGTLVILGQLGDHLYAFTPDQSTLEVELPEEDLQRNGFLPILPPYQFGIKTGFCQSDGPPAKDPSCDDGCSSMIFQQLGLLKICNTKSTHNEGGLRYVKSLPFSVALDITNQTAGSVYFLAHRHDTLRDLDLDEVDSQSECFDDGYDDAKQCSNQALPDFEHPFGVARVAGVLEHDPNRRLRPPVILLESRPDLYHVYHRGPYGPLSVCPPRSLALPKEVPPPFEVSRKKVAQTIEE